jgi:integrase
LEEMDRVGSLYKDVALVFATKRGTPLNPSNFRKLSFAPLLEEAGLPAIWPHDLRHTCATLVLGRNVNPKIVSGMLGHTTVAVILDTILTCCPTGKTAWPAPWRTRCVSGSEYGCSKEALELIRGLVRSLRFTCK